MVTDSIMFHRRRSGCIYAITVHRGSGLDYCLALVFVYTSACKGYVDQVLPNDIAIMITVGRSTHDHTMDVDLPLEGPAWKVSRRQGTIRLRNNGDFFLSMEGKRAVCVDGRPVLAGNKCRLNNNAIVEITELRFIFLVNQDLISVIRHEAAKMNLQP